MQVRRKIFALIAHPDMKTNKPAPSASVMPSLAELQKLTPVQAACNFVEQARSAIRAFIVAAKLLLVIEPTLKPGQTLGSVIIKLASVGNGERRRVKSTIDNGRYAMRVWKELVETGHVTEAVFDTFTFGDMVAINRTMSGKSRQPLKAADVAVIIEKSPNNWHEELDCLFTYGQCLEDRAAEEQKAKAQDKPAPATTTEPSTTTTTETPNEAQPDDAQGEDAGTSPDSPASPSKAPDESTVASAKADVPGNIVAMPKQVSATVEDALKLIATLEIIIVGLQPADVAKVAPAIAELNDTVQASLKPAKSQAKPKSRRGAKAA